MEGWTLGGKKVKSIQINTNSKDGLWGGRLGGCLEETRPLGEHDTGNDYFYF